MNKTQLAVVCLTLSATSIFAQQPAFKRTVLQQADLSIPGREVVMARVDFPMGASAGRHTHPGEEIGYVLDGTVSVEIEGVAKSLKAGDMFLIPTGTGSQRHESRQRDGHRHLQLRRRERQAARYPGQVAAGVWELRLGG